MTEKQYRKLTKMINKLYKFVQTLDIKGVYSGKSFISFKIKLSNMLKLNHEWIDKE